MARRTRNQWQELIDRQQESGQSAATFCRQHGISATYFSSRKRQLAEEGKSRFVKLIPQPMKVEADAKVTDRPADGLASSDVGLGRLRIIDLNLNGLDADSLALVLDKALR